MSSAAGNQVLKYGILAVEEATVTAPVTAAAVTIPISCKVMTQTPFTIGQEYIVMDDTFGAGVNGLPNAERFILTNISGASAVSIADGIGYTYTATLDCASLTNGYATTANARVMIPGVEMALQSSDFNARFKTPTDAPKIDMDDEASRIAAGSEGRDKSIAGARSAEINFTEKLAWAGSYTSVPVWDKLMRTSGQIKKVYTPGVDLGTATSPTTCADLETLIATYNLNAYDYFHTDGTDTTDNALVAIKGSAIANHNSFQVNASQKQLGVSVTPSTYATLAALIAAKSFVNGSVFYSVDGSDTSTPSLAVAKALLTTEPLDSLDSFRVGAGNTIVYLTQTARYSAAGIGYQDSRFANEVTATIWLVTPENGLAPNSTVYRYTGCHGNIVVSAGKIGDPWMMTGKYQGAFIGTQDITIAQARAFTSNFTQNPEVLLSNTVTVPGWSGGIQTANTIKVSNISFDPGNVLNYFIDQSTTTGNAYAVSSDKDPKLTLNPYFTTKTNDDVDYIVTNEISGKITIQGVHLSLEIFNAQLTGYTFASREGYVNTERSYRALMNNLGNGATEATAPDTGMYELLIGSRS